MYRHRVGREVRCVPRPGGGLLVFDGGALVASHDTTAPAKPIDYDPAHYAEAMGGKRWGGADSDIEGAAGRKSCAESMLEMIDAQLAAVRERDLWRRVQRANFPYARTLAGFDFSFQPSISRPVVEDLANMVFLERKVNVVLVGSPGSAIMQAPQFMLGGWPYARVGATVTTRHICI